MDSSFTRPLVCSFYFLLSFATLYLSFAYYHSKSHQIVNKTLISIRSRLQRNYLVHQFFFSLVVGFFFCEITSRYISGCSCFKRSNTVSAIEVFTLCSFNSLFSLSSSKTSPIDVSNRFLRSAFSAVSATICFLSPPFDQENSPFSACANASAVFAFVDFTRS